MSWTCIADGRAGGRRKGIADRRARPTERDANRSTRHTFHLWRQPFPDGTPEQVSFGSVEEEGLAVSPDGRSLLTSVGSRQLSIWVRDRSGERQTSAEGYAGSYRSGSVIGRVSVRLRPK